MSEGGCHVHCVTNIHSSSTTITIPTSNTSTKVGVGEVLQQEQGHFHLMKLWPGFTERA